MRILHVIASVAPRYGGPSVAALETCAALAARGHVVELFTTDRDGCGRLPVPLGASVGPDSMKTTIFPLSPPHAYATSLKLGAALLRRVGEFDVVHVHSLYLFHGLVACAAARRCGVPYVVRPHGTLNPFHRSIRSGRKAVYTRLVERRNLELAHGVHCTSEDERRHVEAAFPRARTFVVPNGVSAPRGDGAPIALPDFASRRLVTFLGRLTAKKRPVLLVEGFASVAAEHGDTHLVLAGPDDEGLGREIVQRAHELGIGDRISMPGLLDRGDAWALLARSAAFVLPSVDENFGVAVVEAMASGVPVVVTDGVALHREVAEHGAGIVSEPTPDALAAALRRLLDDPGARAVMGGNGRALAAGMFGWDVVAAGLEAVYAKAVA